MLEEAKLTLRADVNNDGAKETGVFRMYGDPKVSEWVRTGRLIGGRGSTVNSILSEAIAGAEAGRKGVDLDLGGGAHGWTIDFRTWEDSGNNPTVTWGDTDFPAPSVENATGADPLTQSNVFMRYLTAGEYDSRGNATFEYGQWSDSGFYSPVDVAFEQQPTLTADANESGFLSGSLNVVATQDISEFGHSALRQD